MSLVFNDTRIFKGAIGHLGIISCFISMGSRPKAFFNQMYVCKNIKHKKKYIKYRKDLNKCPGRLLNVWVFYIGAYSKGALKRCLAVIDFTRHLSKHIPTDKKYNQIKQVSFIFTAIIA